MRFATFVFPTQLLPVFFTWCILQSPWFLSASKLTGGRTEHRDHSDSPKSIFVPQDLHVFLVAAIDLLEIHKTCVPGLRVILSKPQAGQGALSVVHEVGLEQTGRVPKEEK